MDFSNFGLVPQRINNMTTKLGPVTFKSNDFFGISRLVAFASYYKVL